MILFLVLANLFWAGNYIFGKSIVDVMTPLQMTFSRWTIAVCLLFPIAQLIEKPDWRSVFKAWRLILILSVFGVIGYNFLLYEALRFTTSMNAALVNAMNPALIVLLSALVLRERISGKHGVGLLISLLGVLLVLTKGQLSQIIHIDYNEGDLLMLLAILVWSIYSILGRRMAGIPPIAGTAVTALFGLILLLPFAISFGGFNFPLTKETITGVLYMGIFPSVGSFIFWNASIRQIGASRAGIYLNLITVFTAIMSVIMGQTITWIQVLGGGLVFAGVYLTSRMKKPARSDTAAEKLEEQVTH
ncbi:DMT family transporter [Paenibacillus phyllosphaerae]|uniref:DMT family transporter n=1 Tax=Paenibacillus phyllosphaerae TaxID=274593 RepID=UPI0031B61FDB